MDSLLSLVRLLLVCWLDQALGHNYLTDKEHINKMKRFASSPGVSGDHFIGYTGWESLNRQYSVTNVTIIVRVEFDRFSYKHKRLKKTYNRFHIPGALWVEYNEIGQYYYDRNFNFTRSKNSRGYLKLSPNIQNTGFFAQIP